MAGKESHSDQPEEQREREMLKALARTPRLGPKVRDAAKEELRIREDNRAVARAVAKMAAKDAATHPGQPLRPTPTVNGQTPFDRLRVVGTSNWQRRIAKIDPHVASEDERRAFYELSLQIVWLEPTVRRVIADKLGRRSKEYKAKLRQHWARTAVLRICAHLQLMADGGGEPDREKAISEIAKEDGFKDKRGVKQRLRRYGGRWEVAIKEWFEGYEDRRKEALMQKWNKRG